MRVIEIGKRESKICATCEYWQGENLLQSAGSVSIPSKMNLDDKARSAYAVCIKNKCRFSGVRQNCKLHEFRFDLRRYL